jgi:hypothetical protein
MEEVLHYHAAFINSALVSNASQTPAMIFPTCKQAMQERERLKVRLSVAGLSDTTLSGSLKEC